MSAGLLDRAEEKLRSLLGSSAYRPAVLEKLAWVYEQQRDWRAALDVWRELPAEKQRERAVVAAHYCCELGEAALAARRSRPRRARSWPRPACTTPAARARAILAARIAAASGDEAQGARVCIRRRSAAIAHHARRIRSRKRAQALKSRGGALDATACVAASAAERDRAARAAAVPLRAVWSRQHHLALALPELPQLGFSAKRE